jgi:hypothetical protein
LEASVELLRAQTDKLQWIISLCVQEKAFNLLASNEGWGEGMRRKPLLVGFWIVVAGVILTPLSQMKALEESGVLTDSSRTLLILGIALIVVGSSMLLYGALYKLENQQKS